MKSETDLRRDLVAQYRRVGELKLNEMASGNLSCRCEGGMLISPAGATPDSINEETVVFVSDAGAWAEGARPSSEWRMHLAIYNAYPDAGGVAHTHSDHCVAVSCHDRPLPGFHYLVGVFGGDDVPCVPYSTFGGERLALEAAAALKDRSACLLANHGMISRARSLSGAVSLAQRLEILCRQYVLARQLGEPKLLTSEDWTDFHARLKAQGYGERR
jgi:L-fuculose-phosphate aldolase